MQNPKVIDADGHIYENHEEIEEYFEGKYRGMRRARAYPLRTDLSDGAKQKILYDNAKEFYRISPKQAVYRYEASVSFPPRLALGAKDQQRPPASRLSR
jgi:cobalamin-dependent methionine synthase I